MIKFLNRELSFLEFNLRVLNLACDEKTPLLERLKFIAIVSANLDEFFMVRYASVKQLYKLKPTEADLSGLLPFNQIEKIRQKVLFLEEKQQKLLADLLDKLSLEGIKFYKRAEWDDDIKKYLRNYFESELLPILSPIRYDETSPNLLTNLKNLVLNIAFLLKKDKKNFVSIVTIHSELKRVVFFPHKDKINYVLVEDIIKEFAKDYLFLGYEVKEDVSFVISRDADFSVDEDSDDFISAMEQVLEDRNFSDIIRINIDKLGTKLSNIILQEVKADKFDIYQEDILDLKFLFKISSIKGFSNLNYKPHKELEFITDEKKSIWKIIKEKDILLHHPYNSFSFILNMIKAASSDSKVLAIKMTLYRVSGNSPIIGYLKNAIENGKQVTILVELKARFDESNNIEWAQALQKAGAIVVYGIKGLKVHAKSLIIIRKEKNSIKKYVHMSTGNYNDKTAKLYTDLSLITSSPDIAYEISLFFNIITGYSDFKEFNSISVAPFQIKEKLLYLIEKEIENTKNSSQGLIMAKMNALNDPDIIKKLYQAANNNVKIYLNIRGICSLIPNKNIVVNSVVGRYLEHARIFYFLNGGDESYYLSSADWMVRNLCKRIELMFPIKDNSLKLKVKDILHRCIFDNSGNSYILKEDGSYEKIQKREEDEPIDCQEYFYGLNYKEYIENVRLLQVRKSENFEISEDS